MIESCEELYDPYRNTDLKPEPGCSAERGRIRYLRVSSKGSSVIRPFAYVAGRKADAWAYTAWGALIWVLGLAPAIQALTFPRGFGGGYQETIPNLSASQSALGEWLGLAVILLALGLGGMGLLLGLALRGARLPKAGLGLWLGAMALALGPLLSSRFGLQSHFSLGLLGIPLVFTAVYLLPSVSLNWAVRQFKGIPLFYAYGSLMAALVASHWAVQNPYTAGLIPGFDIRLHGLVLHANLLAVILLTYLILSWFRPSRTRWGSLHQVVVLPALVLTQSKTVWVLLVLVCLIRLAYAAWWGLPGLQRYTALALLGALFSGGTLYLATGPAWLDSTEVFFSGEDFSTLTGRTLIWQVTLNLWEQNPLFGYGPDLWDAKMGLTYAPVVGHVAPHAHNQFYQSLGVAGIIGVVGLLVYAMALLAYGMRYGNATNGVASALVAAMLLLGITEPSLGGTPGNGNFYIHFLVFAFLMLASKRKTALADESSEPHGVQPSLASLTGGGHQPLSKPLGAEQP